MQGLDYQKIGERIRQARKARGWPQGELAKRCGISLNFMGKLERGERRMGMDTFAALCRELGVGADALLWGIVQPSGEAARNMWERPRKKGSGNGGPKGKGSEGKGLEGHENKDPENKDPENKAPENRGSDSYSMYVRIMESVADIMNGA